MGGFFGAPGFAAMGGAAGFGFGARGGGAFVPMVLFGLELVGESAGESEDARFFFHGVVEPLPADIPGNTDTGFAFASASTDCTGALAADGFAVGGGATLRGGGGGTGAGAASAISSR